MYEAMVADMGHQKICRGTELGGRTGKVDYRLWAKVETEGRAAQIINVGPFRQHSCPFMREAFGEALPIGPPESFSCLGVEEEHFDADEGWLGLLWTSYEDDYGYAWQTLGRGALSQHGVMVNPALHLNFFPWNGSFAFLCFEVELGFDWSWK